MGNLCLTRAGKEGGYEGKLVGLRDFEGKMVGGCEDTLSALLNTGSPSDIFTFSRKLGEGCFGEVWAAVDSRDGTDVAVKIVNLSSEEQAKEVALEVAAMLKVQAHPNIARVYGFYTDFAWSKICVFNGPRMWVIQELIGDSETGPQSLADLLVEKERAKKTTTTADLNAILKQCASALAHMHSCSVIHRDIKPANIMIDADGGIKLIDFGSSVILEEGEEMTVSHAIAGSWPYLPPEAYKGEYWKAGDVFGLGCVLVELWLGKDKGPLELVKGADGETPLLSDKAVDIIEAESAAEKDDAIASLINCVTNVLLKEAVKRLHNKATAATLVEKRKENRGQARALCTLLCSMLTANPSERPTMDAIAEQVTC